MLRLLIVISLILLITFGVTLIPPDVQIVTNVAPTTTSTHGVVENPAPTIATSTETPTPPPAPITPTAKPTVKKTPPAPVQALPPQPTQSDFDATAATLRSALVNILCISGRKDIHSISGSGVSIDPRGTILTNAHIAQHFLYIGDKSLDVTCVIRTGSPARNEYTARLIYLPEVWVNANKNILATENPTGNGEYDFAFLAITGSASLPTKSLPTHFPFIPLSQDETYRDEPVVIGAYAAQFLTSSEIQSALYPTIVFGKIGAIFTFVKTSIDVIVIDGSAASQEGSSGGGIARANSTLAGIITTSTTEGSTADRTLGGITTSYIRREYETETSMPLSTLFAKSPVEAASDFLPQVSKLRSILTASLSQ